MALTDPNEEKVQRKKKGKKKLRRRKRKGAKPKAILFSTKQNKTKQNTQKNSRI